MIHSYSLEFILDLIDSDFTSLGDYKGSISGVATLAEAKEGDLSFFNNPKYKEALLKTKASVLLVPKDIEVKPAVGQTFIFVDDPSFVLAKFCREVELSLIEKPAPGIHPSAVVHPTAEISENAYIGPLCVIEAEAQVGAAVLISQISIGAHAKVGDQSILFPKVSVGSYCEIGTRNRLLEGCVVGSDGFGYAEIKGRHERIPQIGHVKTESEVDIGANSTIDRARLGVTLIGEGTKIDNLVQIAHNVQVGKHCLLVSQTGISGSTIIGDNVIFAGKSGAAGHLEIGANSVVGPTSAVLRSIKSGSKVMGVPAISNVLYWRLNSLNEKLPELFRRFKDIK